MDCLCSCSRFRAHVIIARQVTDYQPLGGTKSFACVARFVTPRLVPRRHRGPQTAWGARKSKSAWVSFIAVTFVRIQLLGVSTFCRLKSDSLMQHGLSVCERVCLRLHNGGHYDFNLENLQIPHSITHSLGRSVRGSTVCRTFAASRMRQSVGPYGFRLSCAVTFFFLLCIGPSGTKCCQQIWYFCCALCVRASILIRSRVFFIFRMKMQKFHWCCSTHTHTHRDKHTVSFCRIFLRHWTALRFGFLHKPPHTHTHTHSKTKMNECNGGVRRICALRRTAKIWLFMARVREIIMPPK